jgi:hypothetical protein
MGGILLMDCVIFFGIGIARGIIFGIRLIVVVIIIVVGGGGGSPYNNAVSGGRNRAGITSSFAMHYSIYNALLDKLT